MKTPYQQLIECANLPQDILEQVQRRYREPTRVYHSEGHLFAIANRVEEHGLTLTRAQAIAILFHDVVYVPGAPAGMNEDVSAWLLRLMLSKLPDLTPDDLDLAEQIVRDTAQHIPTVKESALVLDLDLLGLAADLDQVLADGDMVFDEVAPLVASRDEYDQKRKACFTDLLQRKTILHSDELGHFEQTLRENLQRIVNDTHEEGTEACRPRQH